MNQEEFNKLNFPVVKSTVGAVILQENKILLTKRSQNLNLESGKWCLPGGHIDIGETAIEAIKREVKEETNLEVIKVSFFNYYDEFLPQLKAHSVTLLFECQTIGEPKISNEVSEIKWLGKEEALKLDLAFKHKEILEDYFNGKL